MSMNWFFNPCRHQRQNLRLLAAGVLPEREQRETKRHMAGCADCQAHYQQIRNLAASLADYRGSVAGVEPTPAARQRWARALRSASRSESAGRDDLKAGLARWWGELFHPYRRAWGGIAALWLVMWAVNWERPGSHGASGAGSSAPPVITQTFEEERRMLAELIPPADREPADAPRRKPSPRSERPTPWLIG
jgi:anti-sigma factor RsiW